MRSDDCDLCPNGRSARCAQSNVGWCGKRCRALLGQPSAGFGAIPVGVGDDVGDAIDRNGRNNFGRLLCRVV